MTAEPTRVTVRLTWERPDGEESGEYVGPPPMVIGREAPATVILNHSLVSRQHAQLELRDGAIVVRDLGSVNGVQVAGARVRQAALGGSGRFQVGPFQLTATLLLPQAANDDPRLTVAEDGPAPPPVAPTPAPVLLLDVVHPETGQTLQARATPPITIGRDEGNTLVLASEQVSRLQVTITAEAGGLSILDHGSRNGTLLNRQQLVPGQPAPLHSGAQLRIGPYLVALRFASPAGEARQPGGASLAADAESGTVIGENVPPLLPAPPPTLTTAGLPPALFQQQRVPIRELERIGVPLSETVYLAIGGGLGSFVWVDHLLIAGARPDQVFALGLDPNPYGRYAQLCRNSQIPDHERLRSNSDSCPDNLWGWPGYGVRELAHLAMRGRLIAAARIGWQLLAEPALAQTYTPRAGNVFAAIDREARRIGWERIWRYGRVKAIRKTDDGRYVVAYSQHSPQEGTLNRLVLAQYVHLAVGYPGVRFLPDLQEYRERTGDRRRVVNAYEEHEHVYAHLLQHGGVVLVRGRGIVASRIIQRLHEVRAQNANIALLHLVRTPVAAGRQWRRARRRVENHWEFQPFNWPKACWGGELRSMLEAADAKGRAELIGGWDGTTTAYRADWARIIDTGLREGWYQLRFGEVERVEANGQKVITVIRGSGPIRDEVQLAADFIIDCTGLEAALKDNSLLRDMVEHYGLEPNPRGRLSVGNDFSITGLENDPGRAFAAGAITLGGPYAAVDSFLGLQYAALASVDTLTRLRGPSLRRLDGPRALAQWARWAIGVHP